MSTSTNFFLWVEGKETGPISRDEMRARWLRGDFPRGALWKRAGDLTFTDPSELGMEFEPAVQTAPPPPTKPTTSAVPLPTRAELLSAVRKESQYKTLRVVIWAFTAIMEIGGTSAAWKTIEMAPKLGLEPSQKTLLIVFATIGGLVWMLLVAALLQLMLLAVDAVDLLIDQGRHRARMEDPA